MKKLAVVAIAMTLAVAFAASTSYASIAALPFLNDGSDEFGPADLTGFNHGPPVSDPDATLMQTWTGEAGLVEVFKQNAGGSASGLTSSYTATITNSNSDVLLEWITGQPIMSATSLYFVLKDGNNQPSIYIANISDWDRMADVKFTGFWPSNGEISNVQIWGTNRNTVPPPTGQDPTVPEPASVLMWVGLAGAFAYGTKKRSKASA
jgi:hypothetical protein